MGRGRYGGGRSALGDDVKLHVSAEGPLPSALEPYRFAGSPAEIHHLLAFSDALVGESATMASEAIALGVPALYAGQDFPGYTEGLARENLLTLVRPGERAKLGAATRALLDARADFDDDAPHG